MHLLKTKPISTNSATSLVVAGLGDMLAQKITSHQVEQERNSKALQIGEKSNSIDDDCEHNHDDWDNFRTFRMAVWGYLTGGPVSIWFRYLDAGPVSAYVRLMHKIAPASITACTVPGAVGTASLLGKHYLGAVVWKVLAHHFFMVPILNTAFFGWVTACSFSEMYLDAVRKEEQAITADTTTSTSASISTSTSTSTSTSAAVAAALIPMQLSSSSSSLLPSSSPLARDGGMHKFWARIQTYFAAAYAPDVNVNPVLYQLYHPASLLYIDRDDAEAVAITHPHRLYADSTTPTTAMTASPSASPSAAAVAYPTMNQFLSTWWQRTKTDAMMVSIRSFFILGPPQVFNQYYIPVDFRVRTLNSGRCTLFTSYSLRL